MNFTDTFSPVCRLESVRFILALAVEVKLHLLQMDVCTAYLNSDLADTIYLKQPNKILLLKKAIYGLKQAGRECKSKLDGFVPCEHEPCLYQNKKDSLAMILVYVDDLIIACQNKDDLCCIKAKISESFECVYKGPLQLFLGMEVHREGELGEITLCLTQYIRDLLRWQSIENCRSTATPFEAGYQNVCESEECRKVDAQTYQSLIGDLMWLALFTMPNILHSVTKLAQCNKEQHSRC